MDTKDDPSRTEVHEILSNERRQAVIEALVEDGPLELSELAERIGAIEAGESPPPRDQRQSVYVSLHQTHLPKLDDYGVVTYDLTSKEVALAAGAGPVVDLLDPEPTPRCPRLAVGAALVAHVAILGVAAAVGGLSAGDVAPVALVGAVAAGVALGYPAVTAARADGAE
jgi:hypothetical protein